MGKFDLGCGLGSGKDNTEVFEVKISLFDNVFEK